MPPTQLKPNPKLAILSPALRIERAVARCIAADAAVGELPPRIAPYWRAFKSDFSPTPKLQGNFGAFTLYCPFVNTLHLYVYEPNYRTSGVSRSVFNPNCEIIASRLVNIAKAAVRLGEKNCVEFDFRGIRKIALPPDFETNWRRFRGILPDADALMYLMSVDITPLPKLFTI